MYHKQHIHKPKHQPKARFSSLHGKAKEEINKIFLENKQYGWVYNPINTDAATIQRWIEDQPFLELNGKITTIREIYTALTEAKPNERFTITVRKADKGGYNHNRLPVEAICNIVAKGNGVLRLLSEYVVILATKPIEMVEAEAIAKTIGNDKAHPLHEYIRYNSKGFQATTVKILKETITNWDKVF